MSPGPIERLKPYFKPRPTGRASGSRQPGRRAAAAAAARSARPGASRAARGRRSRWRAPADAQRARLAARREQLAGRYGELQSDLGGLVYEMAMRDHFRLDLVVRRAAELQAVDSELSSVEQRLGIATRRRRRRSLPVVRLAGPARRRTAAGAARASRSRRQAAPDPTLRRRSGSAARRAARSRPRAASPPRRPRRRHSPPHPPSPAAAPQAAADQAAVAGRRSRSARTRERPPARTLLDPGGSCAARDPRLADGLRFASLRWAALPIIDRRWTAPLSAIALGFGLFVGVAIGPGTEPASGPRGRW